ncbi:MAG TPA: hypothetical protein VNL34_04120 [Candidatus Nitrosotenuis sp.]|nr:hypothetical protein [Candidatus Nitrosotenuis sp.]
MLQKQIPRITCLHKNHTVTDSDEILCSRCGVVLDVCSVQEGGTESTLNLFQQIQVGGKTAKIEASRRVHEQKFYSSSFSNACSKLGLPVYAALDAWTMFSRLEKRSDINANAAIAVFSLFTCCKRYAIPRTESDVKEAVMFAFSLKRTPTVLKASSFVHTLLIAMTENEKNKIISTIKIDSFEYYLNIYLSRIQNPVDRETLKDKARRIAKLFSGNDEYKARMAVRMIKGVL